MEKEKKSSILHTNQAKKKDLEFQHAPPATTVCMTQMNRKTMITRQIKPITTRDN